MFLGQKLHTAGNHTRYKIDYSNWLDDGVTLSNTATVVLDPAFTATVTDVVISGIIVHPDHLYFTLAGGAVNEAFTLDVQVTDSRTGIKNDTVGFQIVAP